MARADWIDFRSGREFSFSLFLRDELCAAGRVKGKEERKRRAKGGMAARWQRTGYGRGGNLQWRIRARYVYRYSESCGMARKWNNQWHEGTPNTPLSWFARQPPSRPSSSPFSLPAAAIRLSQDSIVVSVVASMETISLSPSPSLSLSLCLFDLRRPRWWIISDSMLSTSSKSQS